jgi:hypothetical protein
MPIILFLSELCLRPSSHVGLSVESAGLPCGAMRCDAASPRRSGSRNLAMFKHACR